MLTHEDLKNIGIEVGKIVEQNITPSLDKLHDRLDNLERGQEDIKLRLDNVAYRFELVELQKRVQVLEQEVAALRR